METETIVAIHLAYKVKSGGDLKELYDMIKLLNGFLDVYDVMQVDVLSPDDYQPRLANLDNDFESE